MQRIPITRIVADSAIQPREMLDDATVADYLAAMQDGGWGDFPPLEAIESGGDIVLYAGFTRLAAASLAGLAEVPVRVQRGSREDAAWLALSSNARHGLRLSPADKRRAVRLALQHPRSAGMSDRALAKLVGCSHPLVAAVRRETGGTPPTTGKISTDGDVRPHGAPARRVILDDPRAIEAADDFGDPHAIPEWCAACGVKRVDGACGCIPDPVGDTPPWAEDSAELSQLDIGRDAGPRPPAPVAIDHHARDLAHCAQLAQEADAAVRRLAHALELAEEARARAGLPPLHVPHARRAASRAIGEITNARHNLPEPESAAPGKPSNQTEPSPDPDPAGAPAPSRRREAVDPMKQASDGRIAAAVYTLLAYGTPPPERWLPDGIRIDASGVLHLDHPRVTYAAVSGMYAAAGVKGNVSVQRSCVRLLTQAVAATDLRAVLAALVRASRKRAAMTGDRPALRGFVDGIGEDAVAVREAGYSVLPPAPKAARKRGPETPPPSVFMDMVHADARKRAARGA